MKSRPPNPSLASLPDDPAALKTMIAALMERADALETKSLRLEMELLKYKKWMYGPRADRLTSLNDVAQMLLIFGEDLEARPVDAQDLAAEAAEKDNAAPRRVERGKGRRSLAAFDSLPAARHEHDLPEGEKPCPCCGTMRAKIGEESSWQIEFIPGRFERLEHVRFKYACTRCEQSTSPDGPQIQRADKPMSMLDKGLAGPGLLAYIVTSKYADYLPLYRLQDIFAVGDRVMVTYLAVSALFSPLISLNEYVGFAMFMTLGMVIAFQLPVAMMVGGWVGILESTALKKTRKGVRIVSANAPTTLP